MPRYDPIKQKPGEVQGLSEEKQLEAAQPAAQEEISYHAVQKDGNITAIWEMRGRKHLRTIDPRSEEGRHLLGHHEPQAEGAADASHGA